jgi:hypothetical protein
MAKTVEAVVFLPWKWRHALDVIRDVGSSIHNGLNSASFDVHSTASGTSQRWLASIICKDRPLTLLQGCSSQGGNADTQSH